MAAPPAQRYRHTGELLTTGLALPARALTMLQPASVSTDAGQFNPNTPIGNLIDQSGLSAPYTSGVTSFNSYTSTTTSANSYV